MLKPPPPSAATPTAPLPTPKKPHQKKLWEYIKAEVTRGYQLDLEEERFQARREKVYMFMNIPWELERLMGYGFFQCADAFLFVFTYLPLRVFFSLSFFVSHSLRGFFRRPPLDHPPHPQPTLKPAEICDLLKLSILLISVYLFTYLDTSVLYHLIKSQSVIKLYIFFNMLEVGDRLFASFVQDTIDALFLTATETPPKKSNPMGLTSHIFLAVLTVFGHAFVILLQGTTLSVAINASNRALLTIMMSNNFVELKGAVFKKFDKMNLFQVSCSDVRERFHLFVLLLVVGVQTMREYSWAEARFWVLFPDCFMVFLAEIGVDWLKHAFITRFNEIPAEVYREYTLSLAYDLAQTKQRRAFSDHSDMVGRRLGFVPLPLAIVLARVLRPCLNHGGIGNAILCVLFFLALGSYRTMISIGLLGKACDLIDTHTTPTSPSLEVKQERPATPAPVEATPTVVTNKPTVPTRSYSASHTPRPSLTSINDLPPLVPSEYQDDKKLLQANSTVSILSVDFNEEMVANSKDRVSRVKLERKHSLGSNLVNEGFEVKEEESPGSYLSSNGDEYFFDDEFGVGGGEAVGEEELKVDVKQEKVMKIEVKEEGDETLKGEIVAQEVIVKEDEETKEEELEETQKKSKEELDELLEEPQKRTKKKSLSGWFKDLSSH